MSFANYALQRVIVAALTILGTIVLVFALVRVLPGDPALALLGDYAPSTSPEELAELRSSLGLDRPLPEQLVRYVVDVLQGDLGTSFRTGQPVIAEIAANIPATLVLIAASLIVTLGVGIPAGIFAASHRNRPGDYLVMTGAMLALASPSFWFAILLIYVFAYGLGWFPTFGAGTGLEAFRFLVLPAVAVGLRSAALVARMTRSTMLEVLGEDYVRTAHAKGLFERGILYGHALPNAALPIVTIIALDIAFLLSSAIVIEAVFARPGLGKLLVDAMIGRDYPVVQGTVLVFAVGVVIVNSIADLAFRVLDPRLRKE